MRQNNKIALGSEYNQLGLLAISNDFFVYSKSNFLVEPH